MPAPLTALIVDDEPLARQELQFLLEAAGDVHVAAQGANGIEAVDLIRTHKPDVLFLDVRMPGLDGFAVLKKVLSTDRTLRMPQIVFATAFDQYAVRAFEVNAVDYLLKPFDSKRLTRTLEKVRARIVSPAETQPEAAAVPPEPQPKGLAHRVAGAEAKLDALLRMLGEQTAGQNSLQTPPTAGAMPTTSRTGKVIVRAGSRLLLVDQREICFATIDEGEITIVTKTVEGSSNVRTLDDLMDQLDPDQFWRPHRSFVVNLQHIREVVPWFKGSYQLRMDDRKSTEVPVSRMQTRRLRELFSL
jgi:two-component system, LytTR family, response regulator LytT